MNSKVKNFYSFFLHHMWILVVILSTLILLFECGFLVFTTSNNSTMLGSAGGCDILFHTNRIQGIADAWRGSYLFSLVPIYPNAAYGYGYLSSYFYSDLFLYIPAIFVYFGMPVFSAYFIFVFAIGITMSLIMYNFCKKIFKSKNLGLLGSLLYISQNFIILDMFRRSALGEMLGLLFILIGFIGIYNMLYEDFSKPYILLIAMFGLTYSHLISLLLFTLALIIIVLINCKKLFCKQFFIKVSIIFAIYLFLSIGFIIPFARMMLSEKYLLSNPWTKAVWNQFNILDILLSGSGIGILTVIMLLVLRLIIKRTDENRNRVKIIDKLLIFIGIIQLITTGLFPWGYPVIETTLGLIQYPWRLNMLTTPIVPIVLILLFKELALIKPKFTLKRVSVVFIVLAVLINMWSTISYTGTEVVSFTYNNISMGEYLPLTDYDISEMLDDYYASHSDVTNSEGLQVDYTRDENTTNIYFTSNELDDYYDVPLVYYIDYVATITNESGTHNLEIEKTEYGSIRVMTNGEVGDIAIKYQVPTIHKVPIIVSYVSIPLSIIAFVVYETMKKRKAKMQISNL